MRHIESLLQQTLQLSGPNAYSAPRGRHVVERPAWDTRHDIMNELLVDMRHAKVKQRPTLDGAVIRFVAHLVQHALPELTFAMLFFVEPQEHHHVGRVSSLNML